MRLDITQPRRPQPLQPPDAILLRPTADLAQRTHLRLIDGHHHLAALQIRNPMLGAELLQQPHPPPAQGRLERSRRVIQTLMHHPAVVPGSDAGPPPAPCPTPSAPHPATPHRTDAPPPTPQ